VNPRRASPERSIAKTKKTPRNGGRARGWGDFFVLPRVERPSRRRLPTFHNETFKSGYFDILTEYTYNMDYMRLFINGTRTTTPCMVFRRQTTDDGRAIASDGLTDGARVKEGGVSTRF
jgi:hypothetical protein